MKSKYGALVGKYSGNITITYDKKPAVEQGWASKPVESYTIRVKPDVLDITA